MARREFRKTTITICAGDDITYDDILAQLPFGAESCAHVKFELHGYAFDVIIARPDPRQVPNALDEDIRNIFDLLKEEVEYRQICLEDHMCDWFSIMVDEAAREGIDITGENFITL